MQRFQETLESLKGTITKFHSVLWGALVDYITIHEDGTKAVTFKDGTTILSDNRNHPFGKAEGVYLSKCLFLFTQ